ncbi:MAG: hypothetical protein U9R19_00595 [Bacteroidota bacterium]|nr:hypothetical protein [Bacteroidota bacterium]
MYLAPLNYNRYFKKVFSNIDIAKKFLEDFLDVEIQEITPLVVKHKVTDDSRTVEFDFRCKIADAYVIIDMQQWYKPDIIYRFYIYHTLNTALQLENLPIKEILLPGEKIKNVKDYKGLLPVITIIWMVDDNLGFSDDYISYTMMPEKAKIFFEETDIWKNKDIENRIKDILKTCRNNSKGLLFLQKNRLLFAFQKNIVKNEKFEKYSAWFTLAEKTLNKLNKKSDFDEFKKDKVFMELMRRLLNSNLSDDDFNYIKDYEASKIRVELYNEGIRSEGRIEGIEQEKKRSDSVIQQAELTVNITRLYFKDGKNINEIAKITNKSTEFIRKVLE